MITLFVTQLDYGVSDSDLFDLFSQCGRVKKASIVKDQQTQKSRGFAFVDMFDNNEGLQAIETLNNTELKGRKIVIRQAEERGQTRNKSPKPQSSSPKTSPTIKLDNTSRFTTENKGATAGKTKKNKPKSFDDLAEGKAKKQKMDAYKKSGKNNHFYDEDDDDLQNFDLFGRDNDEDLDEDYSRYLLNNDEDE